MDKFALAIMLSTTLAILGCIDMENINQMAAEQRVAEVQRRAARMTGASKDRILRKIADGKLTIAERLQWLEQVKDNATLYEAFSRVFPKRFQPDRDENTILDATIRRIDVFTKEEAVKFVNWRWMDGWNFKLYEKSRYDEKSRYNEMFRYKLGNAMCCEKSKAAFAKLDEQDISAILKDHERNLVDPCACKQCLHILQSRLSAIAQSADTLCAMLTNAKLRGTEDPHRIEERLLAKVAEISPENAAVLLHPDIDLKNEKLIVELIAKLPPEKRRTPMFRLNWIRANRPCIVNGIDWKGSFEIINDESVIKKVRSADFPEDLVVPSSLAGFPVRRIESDAFSELKLKRVVIPDSVRSIGREAFGSRYNKGEYGVDNEYISKHRPCAAHLESVVIGSGVTNVEENAFAYCLSLTNVTIRSGTVTVGKGAFKGCEILENVTIPVDANIVFGDDAFQNCAKLKPIKGKFTYFVGSTFDGCDSYHDDNGFRVIEGVLERHYGNATAVTIPSGVNEIWSGAFADNTKLKTVTIPDGVKRIGYRAFAGCKQLREVTIPKSVKTIEKKAFMGCLVMRKAVLLNADTEIGDNAFAKCRNLRVVETPEGEFSPSTWNNIDTLHDTPDYRKNPFGNF